MENCKIEHYLELDSNGYLHIAFLFTYTHTDQPGGLKYMILKTTLQCIRVTDCSVQSLP